MKYQNHSISCFKYSQESDCDSFQSESEINAISAPSSKTISVPGTRQEEWVLITCLYV